MNLYIYLKNDFQTCLRNPEHVPEIRDILVEK